MAKSVIIFQMTPTKDRAEASFQHVEKVVSSVAQASGCISVEPFTSLNQEGKYCFLCVFESEEAAVQWRNCVEHKTGHTNAHDTCFENYTITLTSVVREYTNTERAQAPQDSNMFFTRSSS